VAPRLASRRIEPAPEQLTRLTICCARCGMQLLERSYIAEFHRDRPSMGLYHARSQVLESPRIVLDLRRFLQPADRARFPSRLGAKQSRSIPPYQEFGHKSIAVHGVQRRRRHRQAITAAFQGGDKSISITGARITGILRRNLCATAASRCLAEPIPSATLSWNAFGRFEDR